MSAQTTAPFVRRLFFFPTPYPDECLYSVLSRYHLIATHAAHRITCLELFGTTPDLRPLVVLPYRIKLAEQWLDHHTGLTWEELLVRHTAWPYLRLSSRYDNDAMLPIIQARGGPGRRKQSAMLRDLLGSSQSLRYCPICVQRDQALYREPYWHLIHQLWGVRYCPTHEVELRTSQVDLSRPLHRFQPASSTALRTCDEADTTSAEHKQQYLMLGKAIQKLMTTNAYSTHHKIVEYIVAETHGDALDRLLIDTYGDRFLKEIFQETQWYDVSQALSQRDFDGLPPIAYALLLNALKRHPM